MQYLLEVIGSTFIGAFFIYTVLNFNVKMSDTFNNSVLNNKNLFDTIEIGKLFDYDFNKIGYRVASDIVFKETYEDEIIYYADVDNNGVIDTVRYLLGSEQYALSTSNPNDKPLFRIINGSDTTTSYVNDFEISYLDSAGSIITPTSSLNSDLQRKLVKGLLIRYTIGSSSLIVEEYEDEDEEFQFVECEKRIVPLNI